MATEVLCAALGRAGEGDGDGDADGLGMLDVDSPRKSVVEDDPTLDEVSAQVNSE